MHEHHVAIAMVPDKIRRELVGDREDAGVMHGVDPQGGAPGLRSRILDRHGLHQVLEIGVGLCRGHCAHDQRLEMEIDHIDRRPFTLIGGDPFDVPPQVQQQVIVPAGTDARDEVLAHLERALVRERRHDVDVEALLL